MGEVGNVDELETLRLVNWTKLTMVRGLGPKRLLGLLSAFKGVENIVSASSEELLGSGFFTGDMLREWERLKEAANENFVKNISLCIESGIKIVPLFDKAYPPRLRRIASPPRTLYAWGDLSLLESDKTFAVVGSREAGKQAKEFAYKAAKEMCDSNYVIISGGANGIDTEAHKGALDSGFGKTVAVLGAGFFNIYPEENKELFGLIKERGLLLGEHLPTFPGSRISYLQRNRMTSGLSDGLLLCASGNANGGTATQVKLAHGQGIPLFCPALELNLLPNAGVADAIDKYGVRQIHGAAEIIKVLSHAKSNSL